MIFFPFHHFINIITVNININIFDLEDEFFIEKAKSIIFEFIKIFLKFEILIKIYIPIVFWVLI